MYNVYDIMTDYATRAQRVWRVHTLIINIVEKVISTTEYLFAHAIFFYIRINGTVKFRKSSATAHRPGQKFV